jgi:hypothetical protein
MSERVWVDTDELTRAAEGYTALADNVYNILAKLNSLGGLPDAFGDDYAGDQFRPNYQEGEDGLRGGLEGLQSLFRYVSDALKQLAAVHCQTEEQNTAVSRQLGDSINQNASGFNSNSNSNSNKPPHYVRCSVGDDMGPHEGEQHTPGGGQQECGHDHDHGRPPTSNAPHIPPENDRVQLDPTQVWTVESVPDTEPEPQARVAIEGVLLDGAPQGPDGQHNPPQPT